MVFELQPVADHLVDPEVQGDGPHGDVVRPGDQHVAEAFLAGAADQFFGLRVDGRLQGDLEEVVGQPDEPVAVHPPVEPKEIEIEQGAGVEVERKEDRHAQEHPDEKIGGLHQGTVVAGVIGIGGHQVARQQGPVQVVESGPLRLAGSQGVFSHSCAGRRIIRQGLWRLQAAAGRSGPLYLGGSTG